MPARKNSKTEKKTENTEPTTRKKPTRMSEAFIDQLIKDAIEGGVLFHSLEAIADAFIFFDAHAKIVEDKAAQGDRHNGPIFESEDQAALALVAQLKRIETFLSHARAYIKKAGHSGMVVQRFNDRLDRWEARTGECWGFISDKF